VNKPRIDNFMMDGTKLKWHMQRVIDHYDKGQRIYPLHIDIGATKICNAKCVYCFGIKQKMDQSSVIPRKQMLDVFGTAPKLGIKSMTITGDGEPTLNPWVYEAIQLGYKNGLDIGFATNGIKITEDQLNILLRYCTWIRFNLSAVDREAYKQVHGVDKWETVQENIRLAVKFKKRFKYNCTIGLQMVLIPQCVDQVVPEAQFAVRMGVDYFVIKQFSDPGCDAMSRFDMSLYDQERTLDVLRAAETTSTENTKIIPKWGMIRDKGKRRYDRCVDCALLFQISGSGKCYPCGYLFGDERYCYGDLHQSTLKEILDSERYWAVVRHMRENFDVHTECKGACRHDFTNAFIWDYLHQPEHINFI
jgi:molybdenum cofactor biosynthesis enzyme MoaA